MTLRIRLFGPQAQLAGRRSVTVCLTGERPDCRSLRLKLAEVVPALAPTLAASRFAVNHEMVPDDQPVRLEDEIALIGMVSGG